MSDDQFTKLFRCMENHFIAVDKKFDAVDAKFSQLQAAVDAYAAQAEVYFQETAARDHQLLRLQSGLDALTQATKARL